VSVTAGACGSTSLASVATVDTAAGGAWTVAARPLRNTAYQARWRSVESANEAVKVRPRVTLRKLTRHRFLIRVAAAQTFGGKVVSVQRFVPSAQRWVRVRFAVLRTISVGSPTVVSGTTVRARVKARTRVRVVLGQGQAGACYVAAASNTVRR
jgi:hypothetical protein